MFQWSNLVIISLTQKCNMNCAYCFLGDKTNLPSTQMSLKTFKQIIDAVVKDHKVYKNALKSSIPIQLLLHGGEPTLLPYDLIDQMLTYGETTLNENNVPYKFMIQTNGIKLNKNYRDVFKKHDVQVGVSIDGLTNNLRESEIDPEVIVNNIEQGLNEGVDLRTLSVATSHNIKDLVFNLKNLPHHDMLKIVVEENVQPGLDLEPSADEEFKYLFLRAFEEFIDLKNTKPSFNHDSSRIILRFLMDVLTFHSCSCKSTCGFKDCGAGTQLISIMPDGMVRLCDRFRGDEDFIEPRIQHVADYNFLSLQQLKKNTEWVLYNNVRHIERGCDWCLYNYICRRPCACSSRKYYGKPYTDEKTCVLTKKVWSWLSEHVNDLLKAVVVKHGGILKFPEDRIYTLKPRGVLPRRYSFSVQDEHTLIVTE